MCEKSDWSGWLTRNLFSICLFWSGSLSVVPELFRVSSTLFLSLSAWYWGFVRSSVRYGCRSTRCFSLKIVFLDASDRFLLRRWWKLAVCGSPLAIRPPVRHSLPLLGRHSVTRGTVLCRHALVPGASGFGSGLAFSLSPSLLRFCLCR